MTEKKDQMVEVGCMAVPVALRLMLNENYTGNWAIDWKKVADWTVTFGGDEVCDVPWIVKMLECGQRQYSKTGRCDLEDLWIDISITSGGSEELYQSRLSVLRRLMLLVTIASFTSMEDVAQRIQEMKSLTDEEIDEILLLLKMNLSKDERSEVKKTFGVLSGVESV